MIKHLCIVAFLALACSGRPAPDAVKPELNLISGGNSDYTIVVPVNASNEDGKAASVLQRYLQQVSGARLSIGSQPGASGHQVFIGSTKNVGAPRVDDLPEGAFVIATQNGNLYLTGKGAKGALYAVYTFLEKYVGCRKYDGGPATVPSRQNITLKDNFTDKEVPAFAYREAFYPESIDTEYLDWHHLDRLYTDWTQSFANQIVPALQYFNSHPEYYALVNGKRYGRQLCLSNDTVLQLATQETRQMIHDHPAQLYWSLSQNDDVNSCGCDRCKAKNVAEGYIMGSVLPFVNAVANQFPNNQFITLAYQYTERATHHLAPAPNVTIFLCNLEATRELPLSEAPSAAQFRTNIDGWLAKTRKLFVWDYQAEFSNFLSPFPNYMSIQPNLEYLKDKGVVGVFEQGSGMTEGDCSALKSYLTAKLLWDPTLSTQDLINDFCQGYYGKAAPFIKTYLSDLDRNCQSSHAVLNVYGDSSANMTTYLNPSLVAGYDQLLAKAEDAVKDNPVYLKRVEAFRLPIEFVSLEQSRLGIGNPMNHGELSQRVQDFIARCKSAGVKTLKEDQHATPDAYAKKLSL